MKILSYRSASILIIIGISLLTGCNESAYRQFELSMNTDNSIEVSFDDRAFMFKPEFTVLYSDTDPSLKLRPACIKGFDTTFPPGKTQRVAIPYKKLKEMLPNKVMVLMTEYWTEKASNEPPTCFMLAKFIKSQQKAMWKIGIQLFLSSQKMTNLTLLQH